MIGCELSLHLGKVCHVFLPKIVYHAWCDNKFGLKLYCIEIQLNLSFNVKGTKVQFKRWRDSFPSGHNNLIGLNPKPLPVVEIDILARDLSLL